jgi:citrate synthase
MKTDMKTHIGHSTPDRVVVRGHDLSRDLIGKRDFVEMLYFLSLKRFPNPAQLRVLNACLVTLMEHGWTPSSIIARMTADSVPEEMQVAMASGVLVMGSVFAGTTEGCARILETGLKRGGDRDAYCRDVVEEHRATKKPVPGFGHPVHKPIDPRVVTLLAMADELKLDGGYVPLLKQLSAEVDRQAGKHVTLNATGAMAALLLEIGFPPDIMRGLSVVARAAGLIGHIVEERETHSARKIWNLAEEHIPYENP